MAEISKNKIENIHKAQKAFQASHQTKSLDFRIDMLKKLKSAVSQYEERILEALWKDLHKSGEEAYLTEISILTQEIDFHIKNLKKWVKPQKVPNPVYLFPSTGRIYYEPLGVVLIIAPWNYPFQLMMNPLVGAIAAGCCAILKPSESTVHIAAVMDEMIHTTFDENYIALVQGDQEIGEYLLKQHFDKIFFTGSTKVGKIVMKAAAENITPVILELGGKSPGIVDENADIDLAAKRIAWGKTINSGQTCIAPDYLLVHHSVKEELIQKIPVYLEEMYGKDLQKSKYYARIVHQEAYDSLVDLLDKSKGNIRYSGTSSREELFLHPTIVDMTSPETDSLMQQEIFGPILPVITYTNLKEAISFINSGEKPLALYYFGKSKPAEEVIRKTSSGGVCINDTLMHIANHHLPFGGVGNSGFGRYHGKESFLAFSNQRAVLNSPTWMDIPFKYAPFKYFKFIKKFL
ncbi:aldehyde dehydrogenase [Gillisia limnaea]|uniref:Aldehyde dehydrogenase n=1 Tax=Gillisia limnaea (strain DSM 15749 / LMG 21470 / R-8282) TaxID=865937 RepID=H2BVP2_GILLR|nr:aldehyde dehydrogenase [Gillisia limnaea]EHQ03998.1 Aldehyde Dehydrogenase [Gillisia limnaea DSM 15749]